MFTFCQLCACQAIEFQVVNRFSSHLLKHPWILFHHLTSDSKSKCQRLVPSSSYIIIFLITSSHIESITFWSRQLSQIYIYIYKNMSLGDAKAARNGMTFITSALNSLAEKNPPTKERGYYSHSHEWCGCSCQRKE